MNTTKTNTITSRILPIERTRNIGIAAHIDAGKEAKASAAVISAEVPLAEMFGYANAIRSLSKGRAEYSMVPARFEIVPSELAARALAKR